MSVPGLNMVKQLAPRHLLENQVKPVCFLKILDQLNDVWMALVTNETVSINVQ